LLAVLFFGFQWVVAQSGEEKLLQGRVVSEDKDVVGVVVQNLGTQNAVITDLDGNFAIEVRVNDTLVFSAVHFLRKILPVTDALYNSNFVEVPMQEFVNQLKEVNPHLKILISIGGWSWSGNFSDAVLTPASRAKFAKTSVAIVADHDLDGVDIDWEYPGQIGDNNVFRPEDKQNYTLMFEALRKELDALSQTTGKEYELTTAVGASKSYIEHTEMDKAAPYLDLVNLMTYDFYTSGSTAGHHSNLYPPEDYHKDASAHKAFQLFVEAGVPPEKLVMGVPFYGRSWIMQSEDNHGINRPVEELARGAGYTYIKDSLVNRKGLVRYWDEKAMAPYLFNSETRQLITYDDEASVKLKCEYVLDKHMAGVMFWQYASDPKEYLLDAMNKYLYP